MLYDKYATEASNYMSNVRSKIFAMDWETRDGTVPDHEMVRILCTTPGVDEITCFTWLAFVGMPRRFPNAQVIAAYCSLDPNLKVSVGKVTSTKKRGGCRTLHAILITSADRIIRAHTEAFGRLGFLMVRFSGKWKKATNAIGRKLYTAIYHIMMTAQKFSYEKYTIMQKAVVFDMPVDELSMLNPDFIRYIRILHDHSIHTTTDMISAYLSCTLGGVRGLIRKFFATMHDYLARQHKYHNEYKKLHSETNNTQTCRQ